MNANQIKDLFLKLDFEPALVDEILIVGSGKNYAANDAVVRPNGKSTHVPFLLHGVLRVMRHDPEKGDMLLYYLEGGDTCAMSISCCLENNKGAFGVVAEEDSEVWMIPMSQLDAWLVKYPNFRRFIFRSYRMRFDELLNTIDSIAFMKMDERLTKYLLDKKQATGSYIIQKTHEEIAGELNTSRVVISRLLKKLEKDDIIEQKRNRIEIL